MEAGMDSLSAVEFRNRLSNELPGIKLPNTLIFDYPTVSAIGNFALKVRRASLCARYCFTGWCFMKLPSTLTLVKLMDVPFLLLFCLRLLISKARWQVIWAIQENARDKFISFGHLCAMRVFLKFCKCTPSKSKHLSSPKKNKNTTVSLFGLYKFAVCSEKHRCVKNHNISTRTKLVHGPWFIHLPFTPNKIQACLQPHSCRQWRVMQL